MKHSTCPGSIAPALTSRTLLQHVVWLVFLTLCVVSHAEDSLKHFESRIRPVLVERCVECHGAEKQKGGLRLDSRAGWESGGESGAAIVPGDLEKSLLIKAIHYTESDLKMPPEKKGGKLSAREVADFEAWVKAGAPDPRVVEARIGGMNATDAKTWWSFQPISQPPIPAIKAADAALSNDIDRFILAGLEAAGLEAAPPADRRTLIRRATYDLTGLPPTPEETEAFTDDTSSDAFAKVVERLLASPHYGEQWGRRWLDVARYADTAGENTDRPLPHIWRYRNWVFDAFNRDLSFDDFVRLQLAGDVLRADQTGAAHSDGIVATGYLAVARRSGHDSDKEVHFMHEDVIDNLGKAFLGLSIACARCHDHKFDPVTAQDYYALYGMLASSRFSFPGCEAKGQPRDLVPMLTPAETDALKAPWRERRAQSEPRLKEIATQSKPARERLKHDVTVAKRVLAAANVAEGGSVTFDDGQKQPLERIAVRKGEILLLVVDPRGNYGADSTRVEWELAEVGGAARRWNVSDLVPALLAGNPSVAAASSDAQWCFLDMKDGPALLSEKVESVEGHAELKSWRSGSAPTVWVNTSDKPVAAWTSLAAHAFFVHPGPQGPVAIAWVSPGDLEVSVKGRVTDVHPGGGDGVAFSLEHIAAGGCGPSLASLGTLASEESEIIRVRDAEAGPEPVAPVAFAVVEAGPVNVRLQQRGDPEKPGEEVPRRWLSIFGGEAVPPGAGSGRLALAEWIVRSPLSTRVMVNRIWQGHFGHGIVRTPNDFGSRGERPTHPELLEWLSARFEKEGRSIKSLHRLIMSSAAYQRASTVSEMAATRDADNRLLSHFTRRRLTAEELRDSLLASGGNLDLTPGAAHPFPPEATWSFTQHGPFNAIFDNAKRTAYQMVQRQRSHPFLTLFDGADPNASTATRQLTTVPTQALYFLNDPFFHSQAARLAASLTALPDDTARLRHAFRTTLQREPTDDEQTWAEDFLKSYPGTAEEKWTACSRVLLAGNEFIHLD